MADTIPSSQHLRGTFATSANADTPLIVTSQTAHDNEQTELVAVQPLPFFPCVLGTVKLTGPFRFTNLPEELKIKILATIVDISVASFATLDATTKLWEFFPTSNDSAMALTLLTVNPVSPSRRFRSRLFRTWFENVTFTSNVFARFTPTTDDAGNILKLTRTVVVPDRLISSDLFKSRGQHVVFVTSAAVTDMPAILDHIMSGVKACTSLKTMVVKVYLEGDATTKALDRLTAIGICHLLLADYMAFVARTGRKKVEISLVFGSERGDVRMESTVVKRG